MLFVFVVASFAWIFFRANTVTDAFIIFKCIFTKPGHLFINTPVVSQATISFVILLFKEIIDEWGRKVAEMSEYEYIKDEIPTEAQPIS